MVLQPGRRALQGHERDVRVRPVRAHHRQDHRGFEGKYAWKFFGENGFTKIEFEADFELPTTFKKEDRTFVMRRTEFDADALMSNLKAKFES